MATRPDLFGRRTLSIEEAAVALGVSRGSAYRAAREGQLQIIQLGRRKLVLTAPLRKMLGITTPKRPIRPPGGAA